MRSQDHLQARLVGEILVTFTRVMSRTFGQTPSTFTKWGIGWEMVHMCGDLKAISKCYLSQARTHCNVWSFLETWARPSVMDQTIMLTTNQGVSTPLAVS